MIYSASLSSKVRWHSPLSHRLNRFPWSAFHAVFSPAKRATECSPGQVCCTQVADWFSGRRPNDLPSPGQRPGNQGDDSPRGPKARSFTGAVQAVSWQMAGPLALDHLPSPVYPARWAGLGKPAGRWPCIEFECLTENLCTTTRHKCPGLLPLRGGAPVNRGRGWRRTRRSNRSNLMRYVWREGRPHLGTREPPTNGPSATQIGL